jgi:hypothetical protein
MPRRHTTYNQHGTAGQNGNGNQNGFNHQNRWAVLDPEYRSGSTFSQRSSGSAPGGQETPRASVVSSGSGAGTSGIIRGIASSTKSGMF